MKEPIELTHEDNRRISEEAHSYAEDYPDQSLLVYVNRNTCFHAGAEYATKYERHILLPQMEYANNIIAGQSERIKELEALLKITPITHE